MRLNASGAWLYPLPPAATGEAVIRFCAYDLNVVPAVGSGIAIAAHYPFAFGSAAFDVVSAILPDLEPFPIR